MQDCCFKGFKWEGTPVGRVDKVGDRRAYVTGNNKEKAIFLCHDAFGWEFQNTRLLADHYAEEVGATVYMPDFFHGYTVSPDAVQVTRDGGSVQIGLNPKVKFDWQDWLASNSLKVRLPEVLSCARILRERHAKLGAVGFCWGGKAGVNLASREHAGLIDCLAIAHPGDLTEEEVRKIGVPVQIIAPEHDPPFPQEMKTFCNNEIPKLGVDYMYQHFPDMVHGFATKCDDTQERERKALELAKNAMVFWLVSHL